MDNTDYTKKVYDKFAKEYHNKRLTVMDSLWNRYIEIPAMTGLAKSVVKDKNV